MIVIFCFLHDRKMEKKPLHSQVPSMHDEGKFVNALIPFWDLSNHSDAVAEISTDYDDEAHVVRCLANKDFGEGEQFTIFYGPRCGDCIPSFISQ